MIALRNSSEWPLLASKPVMATIILNTIATRSYSYESHFLKTLNIAHL